MRYGIVVAFVFFVLTSIWHLADLERKVRELRKSGHPEAKIRFYWFISIKRLTVYSIIGGIIGYAIQRIWF